MSEISRYNNISRFAQNGFNGFDTRAMFEETLEIAGYPHIVRKVDLTKRCSCVTARSDRFNEPDPQCKLCNDLGFLYTDQLVLAYKSYESGAEQAATPSRMRVNEQCFFVSYDTFNDKKVAEYSRVLELATDGNGNVLTGNQVIAEYNIVDAIPYSERGVRIYWKLKVASKEI